MDMDTTGHSATFASPPTRSERIPYIAGIAMTAVFVLFGIDLRAIAWGGLWLRAILPART
jgi:hypothetical protein